MHLNCEHVINRNICSEFTPSCVHIAKEVAMIITRWINCGMSLFLKSGENNKHRRINCFKIIIVIFNYFHSSINNYV